MAALLGGALSAAGRDAEAYSVYCDGIRAIELHRHAIDHIHSQTLAHTHGGGGDGSGRVHQRHSDDDDEEDDHTTATMGSSARGAVKKTAAASVEVASQHLALLCKLWTSSAVCKATFELPERLDLLAAISSSDNGSIGSVTVNDKTSVS